jgi:S-methylmethionine-dependent homocysteine/selenocysteine methylase
MNNMNVMNTYRHQLSQLRDSLFLADGGLETTLVFHERIERPSFAAFDLLKSLAGAEVLRRYFRCYVELASTLGVGAVLESPTWRANPDWAAKLGYDATALAWANREGIRLLENVRSEFGNGQPIVISGNVGPRGDGSRVDTQMTIEQARDYHASQVEVFARSAADMAATFTMNYVEEALGTTLAARDTAFPVAISFTVETDGRLPSGQPLAEAI